MLLIRFQAKTYSYLSLSIFEGCLTLQLQVTQAKLESLGFQLSPSEYIFLSYLHLCAKSRGVSTHAPLDPSC